MRVQTAPAPRQRERSGPCTGRRNHLLCPVSSFRIPPGQTRAMVFTAGRKLPWGRPVHKKTDPVLHREPLPRKTKICRTFLICSSLRYHFHCPLPCGGEPLIASINAQPDHGGQPVRPYLGQAPFRTKARKGFSRTLLYRAFTIPGSLCHCRCSTLFRHCLCSVFTFCLQPRTLAPPGDTVNPLF